MEKEDTEVKLTNTEKKEKSTMQFTVDITPEEFDKAVNAAYVKNKSKISVPGFRKGKVPRKVVEGMYGASVFYEDAVDIILPDVFTYAFGEVKERFVGLPSVDDIKFNDDKSATIVFTMAKYPEISIGEYKGIKAVRPKIEVSDSDIEAAINSERYKNARIETVTDRPVQNEDYVTLDYTGYVDGKTFDGGSSEDYELVIGSNTFIPGFEEKMVGMTTGEERDLELKFPDEYHTKDLAGKPVVFHVKVKEIKQRIVPELDDEFAKDVSEFDTVEEYKADTVKKITEQKSASADKDFEDNVLTELINTVEGDIPEAMIDEYVEGSVQNLQGNLASYGMSVEQYLGMMGITMEEFRKNVRPMAEKNVKNTLALEKVAELENIEPTDEEIEKGIVEIGESYGLSAETAKDQLNREGVIHELKLRAATLLVVANAEAIDPPAEEEKTEAPAETEAAEDKPEAE